MGDQEHNLKHPSEDQDCNGNPSTESRDMINYDGVPVNPDQQRLWHQSEPTSVHYSSMLDDLTRFEYPSPLLQDNIDLNIFEHGESSGTKRKQAPDFLEMKTKERDFLEDEVKEDSDTSQQRKQQRRTRSAEAHNQNERIRRQKHKEKMKALQELIPNCNKRDKSSTLDDAIKYIKTLQYHLRVMSMGVGYSPFHFPMTMMQQPGQQGMQILMTSLPPFLETSPTDMGIPSIAPSPKSPALLPNQYILPSSATLRFPEPNEIQSPSNLPSSSMNWARCYAASSGAKMTQGVTSTSSQGRVLLSKIVLPHFTMDQASSCSTSSEWSSGSTTNDYLHKA